MRIVENELFQCFEHSQRRTQRGASIPITCFVRESVVVEAFDKLWIASEVIRHNSSYFSNPAC